MEDDQNGRRPKLKMTKMEDDQNGRQPKWKREKNYAFSKYVFESANELVPRCQKFKSSICFYPTTLL